MESLLQLVEGHCTSAVLPVPCRPALGSSVPKEQCTVGCNCAWEPVPLQDLWLMMFGCTCCIMDSRALTGFRIAPELDSGALRFGPTCAQTAGIRAHLICKAA